MSGIYPSSRPACRITPAHRVADPTEGILSYSPYQVDQMRPLPRAVLEPDQIPHRTVGHFTVVLDMDETLLNARDGTISLRPSTRLFLHTLASLRGFNDERAVEIILWSAGDQLHVNRCLYLLDPDYHPERSPDTWIFQHVIARGLWAQTNPTLKDLKMLSRNHPSSILMGGREGTTIIVDDSPFVTVCNGSAAIVVPPFHPYTPTAKHDSTLLYVLQVLTRAAHCLAYANRAVSSIDYARQRVRPNPGEAQQKPIQEDVTESESTTRGSIPDGVWVSKELFGVGHRVDLEVPAFSAAVHAVTAGVGEIEAVKAAEKAVAEYERLLAASPAQGDQWHFPTAAALISDHPFMRVAVVDTAAGKLRVLALDVADTEVVTKRTAAFRHRRKTVLDELDLLPEYAFGFGPRLEVGIETWMNQLLGDTWMAMFSPCLLKASSCHPSFQIYRTKTSPPSIPSMYHRPSTPIHLPRVRPWDTLGLGTSKTRTAPKRRRSHIPLHPRLRRRVGSLRRRN